MTTTHAPEPLTEDELDILCHAFAAELTAVDLSNDAGPGYREQVVAVGDNFFAHARQLDGKPVEEDWQQPHEFTVEELTFTKGMLTDLLEALMGAQATVPPSMGDALFATVIEYTLAWNAIETLLAYREERNPTNIMGVDPTDAEAMSLLFSEAGPLQ